MATFTHYIDGHQQLAIEIDEEDVELAKLMMESQKRLEVIKEFMANGYSLSKASTICHLASKEFASKW